MRPGCERRQDSHRRRALLLLNRRARRGTHSIDGARAVFGRNAIELVEPEIGAAGMADRVREAADIDLVIVGGGDGSLNSVARAVIERDLPLGILPLGTANDLARTLAIPPDPVRAAEVIAAGHTRRLDLGEVNGHPFFNVASVGFSADLARGLTAEAKRRWGVLGYGAAALRILSQSRPFTLHIAHDGRIEKVRTIQLSVGNGRFYGGGMTVEANARPDDGRLDVYSLEVPHWWHLLALAPALRRGTQGRWKHVRAFGTTALELTTRRPHDVNADGELVTTTPAAFRILPHAIEVFAPR
ncbi:lipid kinase [Propylenella binzhouense]|uniref:Lipid kinase n=1 Tax=Propylenella binzhouense TaxID=2555902 RepID=A0A964WT65_9HYPH|nr:lipid kinase [Propylenella binzhouense]MYZ47525.1 lipid kinase [Propylenella binzhouense]